MGQQEDDTKGPDRIQYKKKAETWSYKNKVSGPMSSWWAKDGTRDQKEGRDEEQKKEERSHKKRETQSDAADAEWQSTRDAIDLAGHRATQQTKNIY